MTLDIEKLKQAIDDNQAAGWPAMQIPVCHARELITRLEAAEKEVSRLEWIISLHPAIDPSVIAINESK